MLNKIIHFNKDPVARRGFVISLDMKYRKVKIKDVWEVIWRLIIFIAIEMVSAIMLLENNLMILWVIVLLGLLIWIINWHCHYFGYECDKCGHKQQINFWKEFGSLNLVNRKYLKCEKCKKWSRAKILVVKEV